MKILLKHDKTVEKPEKVLNSINTVLELPETAK